MRRGAGKQHLLYKKSKKRKLRLSKMVGFFNPYLLSMLIVACDMIKSLSKDRAFRLKSLEIDERWRVIIASLCDFNSSNGSENGKETQIISGLVNRGGTIFSRR